MPKGVKDAVHRGGPMLLRNALRAPCLLRIVPNRFLPARAFPSTAAIPDGSAARASQSKKGGIWRVVFIVSIVVFVGALAALGAIGYEYWAQQNAYSGLEEYAEVDDNSNLVFPT